MFFGLFIIDVESIYIFILDEMLKVVVFFYLFELRLKELLVEENDELVFWNLYDVRVKGIFDKMSE